MTVTNTDNEEYNKVDILCENKKSINCDPATYISLK